MGFPGDPERVIVIVPEKVSPRLKRILSPGRNVENAELTFVIVSS